MLHSSVQSKQVKQHSTHSVYGKYDVCAMMYNNNPCLESLRTKCSSIFRSLRNKCRKRKRDLESEFDALSEYMFNIFFR